MPLDIYARSAETGIAIGLTIGNQFLAYLCQSALRHPSPSRPPRARRKHRRVNLKMELELNFYPTSISSGRTAKPVSIRIRAEDFHQDGGGEPAWLAKDADAFRWKRAQGRSGEEETALPRQGLPKVTEPKSKKTRMAGVACSAGGEGD